MADALGIFGYSAEQERNNISNMKCKLVSGEIKTYSECKYFNDKNESDESIRKNWPKDFLSRFPDGVILGEGEIYKINGILQ